MQKLHHISHEKSSWAEKNLRKKVIMRNFLEREGH